MSVITGESADT